ncbi:MAG: cation:proton antiporter [Gemmatimonadota bacterium]
MTNSTVLRAVLWIMVLLFIAAVLSMATRRVRIPFPVTLVTVGLVLGELIDQIDAFGRLNSLQLTPDVLTYIFLPTLTFHTAFSLNARLLTKNLLPVLVLAIPATLLSALVAGLGVNWAFGYPIAWAMLFGALITSTDGSAVLSVFRAVGAPKRLLILAEGENLLNDATSIVLFKYALAIVAAGVTTGAVVTIPVNFTAINALLIIWDFVKVFGGGLLVGVLAGWFCGRLVGLVDDDDLIEILLTTVTAFLSFLAADSLGLSGVVAVVGTGLMLGGWGRTKYTPATLHYLESFWGQLAYTATALTFLLVGLATDLTAIGQNLTLIALAVVIALAARAIGIFGLFPLVNRLPAVEKADARYQAVMVWGGLRGAMGLVLAMSIPEGYAYRTEIITVTLGVVLFSVLVQGLSLEIVIRYLGLHRASLPELYVLHEGRLLAKQRAKLRVPELRRGGMFREMVVEGLESSYAMAEQDLRAGINVLRQHPSLGLDEELKLITRGYLLAEKRSYLEMFQEGQLSEKALKELQHSVELQLDSVRSGHVLPKWTITSPLYWAIERAFLRVAESIAPRSDFVQTYKLQDIAARYEKHWARVIASDRVLKELHETPDLHMTVPEVRQRLEEQYRDWNRRARERLDETAEQFPEYATKVQQIMATRICLQAEEQTIQELADLEVLPEREARSLRDEVRAKLRRLRQAPIEELRPRPRELLAKVPFFRGLPAEDFDRVVELLRPLTFIADEIIVREGDPGDSLFLIGRGVVRVVRDGSDEALATLLAGDFFGEMALLTGRPRNATVRAVTHCSLYELRRNDLETLHEIRPVIRAALEVAYRERSAVHAR